MADMTALIAAFIGVVAALVGAAVGSYATYFFTKRIEEAKWRREYQAMMERERWERERAEKEREFRRQERLREEAERVQVEIRKILTHGLDNPSAAVHEAIGWSQRRGEEAYEAMKERGYVDNIFRLHYGPDTHEAYQSMLKRIASEQEGSFKWIEVSLEDRITDLINLIIDVDGLAAHSNTAF